MAARSTANPSPQADCASRLAIGYAEGLFSAFAKVYAGLGEILRAYRRERSDPFG